MTSMRWQDIVNLALGVLVAISPWALGYSDLGAATWSAVLAGGLVALISLVDLGKPAAWEEWVNLVAGLWLIIAPFALGFRTDQAAAWSSVAGGVLIALFAAWALFEKDINKLLGVGTH